MVQLELDFLPHLKQLEDLTKKPWLVSQMSGNYQSTFRGAGMEFEDFAQYSPEQDAKRIDWVSSAKSEKTLMRTFVDERNIKVFALFDTSASMFFSSTSKLKCEYAAELVNTILFAAVASGDLAGLTMSSSKGSYTIPPRSERSQYFRILNALSDSSHYGGSRDLFTPLKELLSSKEKGILFVVSDFLNMTPEEIGVLGLLTKKFVVYCFMIRDKFERELPKDVNAVCVEDPETRRTIIVNLVPMLHDYKQHMEDENQRLFDGLLQQDIDIIEFYTDQPFEGKVLEFFAMQNKKWR